MVHVYLILAHKNPIQLMKMIAALHAENNHFFVHIDAKFDMRYSLDFPPNVRICENRINIRWGGFSMIEATVCLMNMLINSGIQPDYVHLLSGQDFPLVSVQSIDRFFEYHYGKNFIEYHNIPYEGWADNGGMDRITYKWNIDAGKTDKTQLAIRSFPAEIQPFGGSQWWSLTGECVKWLADICRSGELLYDFYRHTRIPDEMFFQTAIMHSLYSETVVNDNLRYINWADGPEYPRILTCEDWNKLMSTGKLFARKFDINKDASILHKLIHHV